MSGENLLHFLSNQILYFLLILGGTVLSLVFALRARQQKAFQADVRRRGIYTTGAIVKRYKDLLHDYFTYNYQHDGKDYSHRQSVTAEAFESISEGAAVRICYIPEDPQRSVLADIEMLFINRKLALAFFWPTLVFGTFFIIFAVGSLFRPI